MAITSTKFLAFWDYLQLTQEGFTAKPGHGYNLSSGELMTKAECEDIYYLNITHSDWISLASNQWVARWRMVPLGSSPGGYNVMGDLSCGGSTTTSITVNWADPVSVKSGQSVSYYKISFKLTTSSTWATLNANISSAARTYTLNSSTVGYDLISGKEYDIRIRFYTSGAEWSNYEQTVCTTAGEDIPELSCGTTVFEGGQVYGQEFYVVTTGGGGAGTFEFQVQPAGIPDRFRIFTGPSDTLLYDSKYIGMTNYYDDLIDAGVSPSDIRLGNQAPIAPETSEAPCVDPDGAWDCQGRDWSYGFIGYISASLIQNNKLKIVIDGPISTTGWYMYIKCPT